MAFAVCLDTSMFWMRLSAVDLTGLKVELDPDNGSSTGATLVFNSGSNTGALAFPLRGSAKPLRGSDNGLIDTEFDLESVEFLTGVTDLLFGDKAGAISLGRLG